SNLVLLYGLGALVAAVIVIGGGLAVLSGRATSTTIVSLPLTTNTAELTDAADPTTPVPISTIAATGTLVAAVQTTTVPTQTPLPTSAVHANTASDQHPSPNRNDCTANGDARSNRVARADGHTSANRGSCHRPSARRECHYS